MTPGIGLPIDPPAEAEEIDSDVDEDGTVYLIASGYEWTCECGHFNHIDGAKEEVICGDESGGPLVPVTPSCGKSFPVSDHGHAYD